MPRTSSISYFDIQGINKYDYLYRYLHKPEEEQREWSAVTRKISRKINTAAKGTKRTKNPLSLLTFGRASTGLTAALQQQLSMAQQEIGFEFVRFHGILDDDMQLYREDAQGNPILRFQRINELVDFLLGIGLKPFLELAFMPSALAKRSFGLWENKSIVSMPKDMRKWNEMITGLVKHFILRYGFEEVKTWKFEIWNEPEYQNLMWNDRREDFFDLWKNTYQSIKAIDKNLQVGGPSIFINTVWVGDWFCQFVDCCKETKTVPDFLTVHFYPLKGLDFTLSDSLAVEEQPSEISYTEINTGMEELSQHSEIKISEEASFLRQSLQQMQETLTEYRWQTLPIYMTEWNSTVWQMDLTADTTYKSAYIIKNILENLEDLDGFGYWTLSDYMEEIPLNKELFHGGFGLVAFHGIKKAAYYSFVFLKRLGLTVLKRGDNYCVFKSREGIQVLLHHYCHFDQTYREFNTAKMSYTQRYGVFEDNSRLHISLSLEMEMAGEYSIREQSIHRESGSAFDEWLRMGAPEQLSAEDLQRLQSFSVPKVQYHRQQVDDLLTVEHVLEPHEVKLIEIYPLIHDE